MRSFPLVLASTVALSLLAGCGGSPKPEPISTQAGPVPTNPPPPAPPQGAPAVNVTLQSIGLDSGAMDRSADACQDFYQYACGGWLQKTEIPGDEPSWTRSFSEITKRNELALKEILEDAAKAKSPDPVTKKLGDYYGACMDEATVEAAGVKPIKGLLGKASKVASAKDVATVVIEMHQRQAAPIFDISAAPDFGDATSVIAHLDQAGLGLPDRDYYLQDDGNKKETRKAYQEHVERMLMLAGFTENGAKAAAADVLSLETEIAKVSKSVVERRDPKGLHNMASRAELAKKVPHFPWDTYFKALGIPDVKHVNLTSIAFFEGVDKLLTTVKPAVWQSYLSWHVVRSAAPLLTKAFADEAFSMQKLLVGTKEQKPRWKRCVQSTDRAMGELLAQPFVARYFGGDSKRAAEQMVQEISKAFAGEVKSLDWMDDKTKARALAKLDAMAYLIGYPAKWRTYEFAVDAKKYAENALAARVFETKRQLAKIGKPVDREEWQMSPPMVNAYYDPQKNHMVFPAGILQPPFYDAKAPVQVNLGAMGMVVGHELTHGFDDEGSQFAGNGNLENWWEPKVGELFKGKTSCVADQYSRYEVLPGVKLNGRLTLGENIADLGGLKLAFQAYRNLRKGAANVLVADGLTEDQQFFLANAQSWCTKRRDEFARLLAQVDPHSAPRFRINGPLSNLPEFAQAFQCKEGTPMHPAKTCAVW